MTITKTTENKRSCATAPSVTTLVQSIIMIITLPALFYSILFYLYSMTTCNIYQLQHHCFQLSAPPRAKHNCHLARILPTVLHYNWISDRLYNWLITCDVSRQSLCGHNSLSKLQDTAVHCLTLHRTVMQTWQAIFHQ